MLQVLLTLHAELFDKLPFFRNQPAQFLQQLLPDLKLEYYAASEYVIWQGDLSTEMYFVTRGLLEVRVNVEQVSSDDGTSAASMIPSLSCSGTPPFLLMQACIRVQCLKCAACCGTVLCCWRGHSNSCYVARSLCLFIACSESLSDVGLAWAAYQLPVACLHRTSIGSVASP